MSAPRFFIDLPGSDGIDVALDADDAHHAAHVLRMAAGDPLVLVAPNGAWDAHAVEVGKRGVRAKIAARSADDGGELPAEVTVLQAVTKGARFDDVVEKTVELGARRIVPVQCERSYGMAGEARVQRWRRIARSAAQQSRRRTLPIVEDPVSWGSAVGRYAATMPLLVGWERSGPGALASAVERVKGSASVAIAVGPEGSLTDEELQIARTAGATFVWLGPTILRTDTAAAAMLAALALGCGWW